MKNTFIAIGLLLTNVLMAQTITGRVIQNDRYKTPLFGATVVVTELGRGQITGLSGNFEIPNIPAGNYHLKISFIGFVTQELLISSPMKENLIIALAEDVTQLEGVEISGKALPSVQATQTNLSTIKVSDLPLSDMPRLLGEPDLIRMIQNLPGVKTESDFTGGFSVRGGRNDQNLILLDGVPVYNPWHMFGLFSAFNTEAIARVELTKGIFPAQYGSRVSSVLDIELQKGDKRLGAGYLTISPISATFSYGRPINQKTSYLLAVRRTYMDPAFIILNRIASYETNDSKVKTKMGYNFLDLNAKVVHTFKPGLSLESGVFIGNDVLSYKDTWTDKKFKSDDISTLRYGWTNFTGSVKLIKKSTELKSVSHLFVSRYYSKNQNDYDLDGLSQGNSISGGELDGYALTRSLHEEQFDQRFTDLGLQQDFTYALTDNTTLYAGAQVLTHLFSESTRKRDREWGFPYDSDSNIQQRELTSIIYSSSRGDTLISHAIEGSVYAGASMTFGKLDVHPGVRLQHYTLGSYTYLLPRVNVTYHLTDRISASAGYGHFSQYVQTVGFDLIRLPTERWFWANDQISPLFARAVTAGIGYEQPKLGRFTIEAYYKTMDNLINFSPKQQAEALQSDLIPLFGVNTINGSGEAYGGEFLWQKNDGDIRGWLGYTLSWVWNTFPDLNDGARYPSRTDKRHDIQTFWTYDFAKNWSVGVLFNYKTGQPLTFSTGTYMVNSDPLEINENGKDNTVITSINGYRLPAYHRLDMSLTWKNRRIFKRPSELSLNVVNVYNRLNVLTASNNTSAQVLPNGKIRVSPNNQYTGQMPIIPMISLRIGLGGDAQ
jgi:outer membrane cobalamin receptor